MKYKIRAAAFGSHLFCDLFCWDGGMPLTLFRSSNNIPRSEQENNCSPVYAWAWATKTNLNANSRHNEWWWLVAEWLAHLTAMQDVSHSHSNPVGNSNWPPYWLSGGGQVLYQRWISGNIHYICLCQVPIRLPTLPLKPREDVTRSLNQGYQWPHKRTCVHREIIFKKTVGIMQLEPYRTQTGLRIYTDK